MERKFYVTLTILWTVIITFLSLVSFETNNIIAIANTDKVVHFSFYFILTFLLLKSLKDNSKFKYLKVILLTLFYGIIIEILQAYFTDTRSGDLYDVTANFSGTVCAALVSYFIFEKISSRKI